MYLLMQEIRYDFTELGRMYSSLNRSRVRVGDTRNAIESQTVLSTCIDIMGEVVLVNAWNERTEIDDILRSA